MSTEIYQRLTPIFADVFDEDDIELKPELTANQVEEWDSLRHIRLIIAIEREFGVQFLTTEANDFKNVGELVETLQTKLNS